MDGAITILKPTCRRSTRERGKFSPANMYCRKNALLTLCRVVREHFTRLDSILMSKRKARPDWWCKEYEEGKVERKEWSDLMKPMNMDELLEAVRSVQAGKAAGPDRLSADMPKYLVWGRTESEVGQPNVTRPGP